MPTEEWNDQINFPLKKLLIIALIAILGGAVAYSAIRIWSPPSAPVNVSNPPTISTPALNGTVLYTGETVQVTVHLSTNQSQQQIFFYENNNPIGSAFTDSNGQAIINRQLTTPGSYVYNASWISP